MIDFQAIEPPAIVVTASRTEQSQADSPVSSTVIGPDALVCGSHRAAGTRLVPGRLAQRESASFTPRRSLVRSQYRPPAFMQVSPGIAPGASVCRAKGVPDGPSNDRGKDLPLPPADILTITSPPMNASLF